MMDHQHVLVVDDDPDIRTVVATALSIEGLAVHACENGADALKELKTRPKDFFSVIVTDLKMPIMDGYEVVRAVQELPVAAPVMLISGHGPEAAGRELGVADALEKPFDPFELAERVKSLAGGGQASFGRGVR
jgi:CheY-like chemotaxis protein